MAQWYKFIICTGWGIIMFLDMTINGYINPIISGIGTGILILSGVEWINPELFKGGKQ